MIKVVHIQYSASSAGHAAARLQNAFLEANIDSSILSLHVSKTKENHINGTSNWSKWKAILDIKIQLYLTRKTNKQLGLFSYPILGTNVSQIEQVKNADIIYIHWALHGFLSLRSINQLAKINKPIIFFMHDMWTITGGCHYSFSCQKYKTHCNDCPIFPGHKIKDLSFKEYKKKLKLYSKYDNLYFVCPSKWLVNCAKDSMLTKNKQIFYIPNVLDNKLYKSFDKKQAKQMLGLDPHEKIIAFGAVDVNSPYKGWPYLQKALEILKNSDKLKNISVLIFGSGYNKQMADSIPFKTKFMGYLKDEHMIAVVYNAADVFVVPSLADNQPTTVMESLYCGTPVVGFDVGGIPDMISHKENGYLAKYKNSEDIARGIEFCIENNLTGKILPQFETSIIIKKHFDLMNSLRKK